MGKNGTADFPLLPWRKMKKAPGHALKNTVRAKFHPGMEWKTQTATPILFRGGPVEIFQNLLFHGRNVERNVSVPHRTMPEESCGDGISGGYRRYRRRSAVLNIVEKRLDDFRIGASVPPLAEESSYRRYVRSASEIPGRRFVHTQIRQSPAIPKFSRRPFVPIKV